MKRYVAGLFACFLFLQSSVHAVLMENFEIMREEKVIPLYVESDVQEVRKELNISQWENVKVIESKVDNGEVAVTAEKGVLKVNLFNGVKRKGEESSRTGVLEIKEAEYDEEKQAVILTPEKEITEITEVYGAFSAATIGENGEIILTVKPDAEYRRGFSKEKTGFSEIEVQAEEENRERNFVTEWVELSYKIADEKVSVIGDTSTVQKIDIKNNAVRIHFSGGVPVRNTEYEIGGYTYFWIDRFEDGSFKKYNPNSIYTTDRKRITGTGTYLDKKQKEEIGLTLQNENWTDFCGIVVNGKKYLHSFDKKKGTPALTEDEVFVGEEVRLEEGKWNTEKYTVSLSKAGVSYIPEGKLYSMGKLVPDTEDWGEEVGNQPWESEEGFLNPITGKFETYVKHYKFFYGPEKKMAFGGYYTYPYRCKVSYKHYLPVKLYSGGICYEYKEKSSKKEYAYSGTVKVEVDAVKTDINFPPTAPYHITFHKENRILSWEPGSDDKTAKEDLRYEVQVKQNGEWLTETVISAGKTEMRLEEDFEDIRIRTMDEEDLYSSWGKLMESSLDLTASVEPYVVRQGEKTDLFAKTNSFYDVVSVKAENEALKLDVSLLPESEEIPVFYEISYEVMGNSPEKTRIATNANGKLENKTFTADWEARENGVYFALPVKKAFEKSGTVVLAKKNGDLSLDFREDGKNSEYLQVNNSLLFWNEETGKQEVFAEIVSKTVSQAQKGEATTVQVIPKLKVNRFCYDAEGIPEFATVELEKEAVLKPLTIAWNTDVSGLTEFHVFCGEKEVFRFQRSFSEIAKVLKAFDGYCCEKEAVEYCRILFLNTEMSEKALKRYQQLWAGENTGITEENKSIYGNQVIERKTTFSLKNVSIPDAAESGMYKIRFTAKDSMGNVAIIEVPILVEQKKEVVKEEKTEELSEVRGKDPVLGRFFYEKNRAHMEELKKPKKGYSTEGFLCAGETLIMRIELRNTDTLMVDLTGDKSIRTLDSLTKRFLCEDSDTYSAEELEMSYQFPKVLYPIYSDVDEGTSVFQLKYVIPYKTKQTLHSWSTLKNSSLEEIDTSKLFDRMRTPYQLRLYPNQQLDGEIKLKFDVFERWDTVLNRDISKYLKNSGSRKKVSLGRK
ncbi:MAG: hypothetical protein J6M02_05315 [Clostridia bacterium]|nr:hypothetical protein [Clostridia bacterium]